MSIFEKQVPAVDGTLVELSEYRGQVLLVVNTASRCSYSRQFAGLQQLHDRYRQQGFSVLGFPCNQFNAKEPDESAEVKRYCEANFGVTFPLFGKIDVRGPSAHPLFRELTEQAPFRGYDMENAEGEWMERFLREKYPEIYEGDGVKWNFTKFLIGRDGRVRDRFETPADSLILAPAIERLL
ncbi:glutathione peroxidase [Cohnella caldifontis]|uniref:glutathione peroxidase n=1 Tax=Cohnella caldifontis TaxID=3027471 RepID=UPI0023EBFB75|nr:glutathione peroxidase [Cohnella sp. YIM B05605]